VRATLDRVAKGQALVDLQNYYFAGTLFGAVQAIQVQAGVKETLTLH
jgi:hypothetical protein